MGNKNNNGGDNVLNELSNKIEQYLEVKKGILDNDYLQVLGDASKIFTFFRNTSALISQKRFESFLKGLSGETLPSEKELERLNKYIDSEEKAMFISDTFTKILLSNSRTSCMIMGCVLDEIINKNEMVSHEYLICLDALMNLFDNDIENFKFINDYIKFKQESIKNYKAFYPYSKELREKLIENNIDRGSLYLTLDKATTYQILSKEITTHLNIDEETPSFSDADNDEYYKVTKPGEILYKLIIKIQNKI